MFSPDNGSAYVILDDVITDFWELEFGVVALGGRSYLGSSVGRVFLLEVVGDNVTARRLHGLPGAPESSALLMDGSLLIRTTDGDVVLDGSAKLTPVRCRDDG